MGRARSRMDAEHSIEGVHHFFRNRFLTGRGVLSPSRNWRDKCECEG